MQVDNIFIFIHQVAGLFRHIGYLGHQQQVNLWLFDLKGGARVSCDVGYPHINFSLPKS